MSEPFHFKTSLRLIQALGIKAKNLQELLEGLKIVPLSSVYYHTHRLLYQQILLSPEPPNDFAYWINHSLNLKELSESMASINIISFNSLKEIKNQLIKILTDYINIKNPTAISMQGQEFHFMKCQTFVLPTPFFATNINEFYDALKKVSINSLYFHLIESRLRLKNNLNDFSLWLKSIGEEEAALKIEHIDPYTITLEGLRKKLISLIKKYAQH